FFCPDDCGTESCGNESCCAGAGEDGDTCPKDCIPGWCGNDGDCDDLNPCTMDACSPMESQCVYSEMDGLPCPGGVCMFGACLHCECTPGQVECQGTPPMAMERACLSGPMPVCGVWSAWQPCAGGAACDLGTGGCALP
ncbi:MAG: hypothetical protein FJ098_15485, partial [Deltaproteobacteria bacterium]|nr:hypothetical protein [Deltaproteobacteria bacterium]